MPTKFILPKNNIVQAILVILFCAFNLPLHAQNPVLLNDCLQGAGGSDARGYTQLNTNTIFYATDINNGAEIWITDGTTANTKLLKDINVGAGNSYPTNFIAFNNKVYFSANDGINGKELWVTDGTANGTVMLKDINPLTNNGSWPNSFVVLGNKILFRADNGSAGEELWITDGTATNTTLLKDIYPGTSACGASGFTLYKGKMYFAADDGIDGDELWVTDGTTNGTFQFKNINTALPANISASNPQNFTVFNNLLFFSASEATHGNELWSTDGTVANTTLYTDINDSSAFSSFPHYFAANTEYLFFNAFTQQFGAELWAVSKDNTKKAFMVKDIHSIAGPTSSDPEFLYVFKNKVYFSANDGISGKEVFVSDGTANGTFLLKDLCPTNSFPNYFTTYNGKLYFTAKDNALNTKLFETDSSAASIKVIEPNNTNYTNSLLANPYLTVSNGTLFYTAYYTTTEGIEPYTLKTATVNAIGSSDLFQFNIFPNPASANITIKSNVNFNAITIANQYGQQVYSAAYKPTNFCTISTSGFGCGIYFLNIVSNNGNKSYKLEIAR